MAAAATLKITAETDGMKLQIAERYFRCCDTDPEKAEYLKDKFRRLTAEQEANRQTPKT